MQPKRKRTRTQFTKHQLETLEAAFNITHYPDVTAVEELSGQLSLQHEKISIWFQNRRARFKKQKNDIVVKQKRQVMAEATMKAIHQIQPIFNKLVPAPIPSTMNNPQNYPISNNQNGPSNHPTISSQIPMSSRISPPIPTPIMPPSMLPIPSNDGNHQQWNTGIQLPNDVSNFNSMNPNNMQMIFQQLLFKQMLERQQNQQFPFIPNEQMKMNVGNKENISDDKKNVMTINSLLNKSNGNVETEESKSPEKPTHLQPPVLCSTPVIENEKNLKRRYDSISDEDDEENNSPKKRMSTNYMSDVNNVSEDNEYNDQSSNNHHLATDQQSNNLFQTYLQDSGIQQDSSIQHNSSIQQNSGIDLQQHSEIKFQQNSGMDFSKDQNFSPAEFINPQTFTYPSQSFDYNNNEGNSTYDNKEGVQFQLPHSNDQSANLFWSTWQMNCPSFVSKNN
ncbi:hypothetical protein SNEBB_007338 [Seison nebaliae]|nr:hypothetical protein SNEBB_007338 [Seison nebaliae]